VSEVPFSRRIRYEHPIRRRAVCWARPETSTRVAGQGYAVRALPGVPAPARYPEGRLIILAAYGSRTSPPGTTPRDRIHGVGLHAGRGRAPGTTNPGAAGMYAREEIARRVCTCGGGIPLPAYDRPGAGQCDAGGLMAGVADDADVASDDAHSPPRSVAFRGHGPRSSCRLGARPLAGPRRCCFTVQSCQAQDCYMHREGPTTSSLSTSWRSTRSAARQIAQRLIGLNWPSRP